MYPYNQFGSHFKCSMQKELNGYSTLYKISFILGDFTQM